MNDNKSILLNVKDKQLNQHTLTKIQEKCGYKNRTYLSVSTFQEVIYEHATNEPDTNAYFEQTIWALEGSWILNSSFSVSNN